MMNIKFNKFERVAGLFVFVAIAGAILSAISVAVKQGWFEHKVYYSTTFENGDGIHPGTLVQMAGLRAGSVDDVELQSDNKIKVSFYVLGKFQQRIRQNSKAELIRPFLIGDRVLEVSVGDEKQPVLAEHANVKSEETVDLMTVMSGKKMNTYMSHFQTTLETVQSLAEDFLSHDRAKTLVKTFDRIDPLVNNLNIMSQEVIKLSRQATNSGNMEKVMSNAANLTEELNVLIPQMNKENPRMGQDVAKMVHTFGQVTEQMSVAIKELGPEAPATARRAVEALNEATVLIKAMQKSMLLRGNVNEVREEESKDLRRLPANTNGISTKPINSCEPIK